MSNHRNGLFLSTGNYLRIGWQIEAMPEVTSMSVMMAGIAGSRMFCRPCLGSSFLFRR